MILKKPKFWDFKKPNFFAYLLYPLTIFVEIHNIISGNPLVGDNVEKWLGQMCSFPVNYDDPIKLKSKLINDYQIEIPVMAWNDKTLMRISLNGYNSSEDVDKLLDVLKKIIL